MKKFYKRTGWLLGICFTIGFILIVTGTVMGARGIIVYSKESGFEVTDAGDKWNHTDMDLKEFNSIYIDVDTADINILPSKDGKYGIELSLISDSEDIQFENEDGQLVIKDYSKEDLFTIDLFSFWESLDNEITIYVPQDKELDMINVKADTGDLDIQSIKGSKELVITNDVGDVDIKETRFEKVNLTLDVGDVNMQKVDITDKFYAKMDVGDFDYKGNLYGEIDIVVNVGDVDIKTGVPSSDYKYNVSINVGDLDAFGVSDDGFDGELQGNPDGKYTMNITVDVGDVKVE